MGRIVIYGGVSMGRIVKEELFLESQSFEGEDTTFLRNPGKN